MIDLLESKIRNYYDTSIKTTAMRLAISGISDSVLVCQWNRSQNAASVLPILLIGLTAVGSDGTVLNWEVDEASEPCWATGGRPRRPAPVPLHPLRDISYRRR